MMLSCVAGLAIASSSIHTNEARVLNDEIARQFSSQNEKGQETNILLLFIVNDRVESLRPTTASSTLNMDA